MTDINAEFACSWGPMDKVYALGHRSLAGLLDQPVIVEEKVDGSQFSFGVFDGVLKCRSKNKELILNQPEKMFAKAIEQVKALADILIPGCTYRGEYLQKPKHNALAYERVPEKHIMIFDIVNALGHNLTYPEKKDHAFFLGLECVPLIFEGKIEGPNQVREFLTRTSILGGQLIEGAVIKNERGLAGKYVSESFKEVHKANWKQDNPGSKDILAVLGGVYCNKARWNKAIQHLSEADNLTGSPKDIGALIKEAQRDIQEECEDDIKEQLYKWAKPHILRAAVRGLPEWYKDKLLEEQT